eukprot:3732121-Prymnesium_polylepis.1
MRDYAWQSLKPVVESAPRARPHSMQVRLLPEYCPCFRLASGGVTNAAPAPAVDAAQAASTVNAAAAGRRSLHGASMQPRAPRQCPAAPRASHWTAPNHRAPSSRRRRPQARPLRFHGKARSHANCPLACCLRIPFPVECRVLRPPTTRRVAHQAVSLPMTLARPPAQKTASLLRAFPKTRAVYP